jgi:hypothetical protein
LRSNREDALAWERRWSRPAALATLVAVALAVASIVVATQAVGTNEGSAELLLNADAHRGATWVSSILQALGLSLLAAPLYFLFRAANARSEAVRSQLVGVVVAAPLFLGVAAILFAFASLSAASDFVANEVPRLTEQGIALSSDRANEIAADVVSGASLSPLAAGFELGGRIGFVVAMFYTALQAMRTGLLTRFWGSLGMALGAVSFLPPCRPFTLIWFIYLGLLLAGWVPGGKPPAWASGEAEPWPTPGEKAADDLSAREDEVADTSEESQSR